MKKYTPYLILLLVSILACSQLAFLRNCMKWDAVDESLPWRSFVSGCLRSGILPMWNPYMRLGYPIHADIQSVSWYPTIWVISLFKKYNIYTLGLEYVFHVFMAGCGMYLLAGRLKLDIRISLLCAICYMLSGYLVGNAQHFPWIVGAAWIPFIIWGFIALIEAPGLYKAIRLSFFGFLMLTGGYPGLSIILFYLLLGILITRMWPAIWQKNWNGIAKTLKFITICGLFAILMSAVYLISIYLVQPYYTREGGVTIRGAEFGPFSPRCLISLILPFATLKSPDFFNTDVSMANMYFGLLILVFFIAFLFLKKDKTGWLFLGLGLFCLLASFGDYFFLRAFLYHFVPGMNYFRFPAVFRVYTILFFILCGGMALQKTAGNLAYYRRKIIYATLLILLLLISLFALSAGKVHLSGFVFFKSIPFEERINAATIYDLVFIQSAIQICFLIVFIFIIYKSKDRSVFLSCLLILGALEMICAVQLNAPRTVYSSFSSAKLEADLQKLPQGYPVPPDKKVKDFNSGGMGFDGLWKNLDVFYKRPAWDGSIPFIFKNYESFMESPLKDKTMENKVLFLSDNVHNIDSLVLLDRAKKLNPSSLFFYNEPLKDINALKLSHSIKDSVLVTSFLPGKVTAEVQSANTQILTQLQCYYYGWQAYINGKKAPVYLSNYAFMSIIVPPGKSEVVFKYENKPVEAGLVISVLSLLLALGYLGWKTRSEN